MAKQSKRKSYALAKWAIQLAKETVTFLCNVATSILNLFSLAFD